VISRRFNLVSVVLSRSRGFSDWGQVIADQVVTGSAVDRLLHTATVRIARWDLPLTPRPPVANSQPGRHDPLAGAFALATRQATAGASAGGAFTP